MSYWINNFIFELLKYYIIGGICLVLLKAFGYYEDYLVILYLLYSFWSHWRNFSFCYEKLSRFSRYCYSFGKNF